MPRLTTMHWTAAGLALAALTAGTALEAQERHTLRMVPIATNARLVRQAKQEPGKAAEPAPPKEPAKEPAPPKEPPKAENEPAPPKQQPRPREGLRDPSTVDPDLRPVLDPAANARVIPTLALRGRVATPTGASGVLDVNGQLFIVREGVTIEAYIVNGSPITIHVKTFNAAEVVVEIVQLGKTFRMR